MILLAVDTSTTTCSVALFNGDRLLAEEVYTAGKTHSRHLLSIIHRILKGSGCEPANIGGIALAFPLSLLDCPVVAMIDARRGEVYHARYHSGIGAPEPATPVSVCAPETAAAALPEDAILVGSGAVLYREVFESRCPGIRFADSTQHVIRAASVGMLAMTRFSQQNSDSIDALIPEYIRKAEAQIQMPVGHGAL
ncbi:MAG: tRNA (adenosine(37)-N6)-threonylcarbamoyltransferase complex dimerization subunit type 1 TsaB [Desulfosarcina sp.]|nr:tRNA (adenosine(37)-N6)-threonylcarbamoyltransferase complex dimerization subunit type 1 TsaB [Desulfosarcina sp.]